MNAILELGAGRLSQDCGALIVNSLIIRYDSVGKFPAPGSRPTGGIRKGDRS